TGSADLRSPRSGPIPARGLVRYAGERQDRLTPETRSAATPDPSPAVLADRARIDEQVAGRTLIDALADTVRAHGEKPAYSDKHHVPDGESWRTITWSEVHEGTYDAAAGLIALGVQPGDT